MTVSKMSSVSPNASISNADQSGFRAGLDPSEINPRIARLVLQGLQKRSHLPYNAPCVFTPRMDLYDDESLPQVTALLELPGIAREDMSVVVRDGKLIVSGQRNNPLASRLRTNTRSTRGAEARIAREGTPLPRDAKYRNRELRWGRFRREIDIPAGTQTEDVLAEMCDGMLFLSWPRAARIGDHINDPISDYPVPSQNV